MKTAALAGLKHDDSQLMSESLPMAVLKPTSGAQVKWPDFEAQHRAIFGDRVLPAGTIQELMTCADIAPLKKAPLERGPPSPQRVASMQRLYLYAEHRMHEDFGDERAMAVEKFRSRMFLRRAADSEVRAPGLFLNLALKSAMHALNRMPISTQAFVVGNF